MSQRFLHGWSAFYNAVRAGRMLVALVLKPNRIGLSVPVYKLCYLMSFCISATQLHCSFGKCIEYLLKREVVILVNIKGDPNMRPAEMATEQQVRGGRKLAGVSCNLHQHTLFPGLLPAQPLLHSRLAAPSLQLFSKQSFECSIKGLLPLSHIPQQIFCGCRHDPRKMTPEWKITTPTSLPATAALMGTCKPLSPLLQWK